MNTKRLFVSLLIPLYNEEAGFGELLKRLLPVLGSLNDCSYEIIFVNDGSVDRTAQLLQEAVAQNSGITAISLSRNFGHQMALTAALDHAQGDVAIMMDGDLQDPPELIPTLLQHFREGADIVYTYRVSRTEPWHLKFCYFLYYRILNMFTRITIAPDSGDFGLISRRVIDVLKGMDECHRFLRGLRAWSGFKQVAVPIERPERFAGLSKYTFAKLITLGLDGILSFSITPLRIATICGFGAIVLSALFALYSICLKVFYNISPTGFTALTVVVTFMSGAQLFFLGVIGEYVGRTYEQSKRRPHYIIDKILRSKDSPSQESCNS